MTTESRQIRTRVKVCGMTDAKQVSHAIRLGVDAIGMILHANSPREITRAMAKDIRQEVPAFVDLVGVFVNASAELINEMIDEVGLDLVQLHGDEDQQFASRLAGPFTKAIRVKDKAQVVEAAQQFPLAKAILLDPYVKGQHGGTGRLLDSNAWPQKLHAPLILAGGLSATNIAQRVEELSPFAVDINSGIELEPGVKCLSMMEQAILAVRRVDSIRLQKG